MQAQSLVDSDPPIALDKFIRESGLSAVTLWRYRRAGWLTTLNIAGRHYVTRSEIARFNRRAAAGEFAKIRIIRSQRTRPTVQKVSGAKTVKRRPKVTLKICPDASNPR